MSFDWKSAAIGGAVTLGLAGLINQFLKYKNQPSALPSTVELKGKMKEECAVFLDAVRADLRNMNGAAQWYKKLTDHVKAILVLVNNLPDLEGLDANGVMRLNELEREALRLDAVTEKLFDEANINGYVSNPGILAWLSYSTGEMIGTYRGLAKTKAYSYAEKNSDWYTRMYMDQGVKTALIGGAVVAGIGGLIYLAIRGNRAFNQSKRELSNKIYETLSTNGFRSNIDAQYVEDFRQRLLDLVESMSLWNDTLRSDVETAQYYDSKVKEKIAVTEKKKDKAIEAAKRSAPDPEEMEYRIETIYDQVIEAYRKSSESNVMYGANKTYRPDAGFFSDYSYGPATRSYATFNKWYERGKSDDDAYEKERLRRGYDAARSPYGSAASQIEATRGKLDGTIDGLKWGVPTGVLAGAGAGAAAGSIVPGVGTLIGAGIGAGTGLVAGVAHGIRRGNNRAKKYLNGIQENRLRHLDAVDAEVARSKKLLRK
jgi:hypothetical protein